MRDLLSVNGNLHVIDSDKDLFELLRTYPEDAVCHWVDESEGKQISL